MPKAQGPNSAASAFGPFGGPPPPINGPLATAPAASMSSPFIQGYPLPSTPPRVNPPPPSSPPLEQPGASGTTVPIYLQHELSLQGAGPMIDGHGLDARGMSFYEGGGTTQAGCPGPDAKGYMKSMWEDQKYCDVTLVCDGSHVMGHRCVLSVASPVFGAMLEGEMREARTQTIELVDFSAATVEAVLGFVYTGQLPAGADLGAALAMAHRYEIEPLIAHTAPKLVEGVNADTVADAIRALRPFTNNEAVKAAFGNLKARIQRDSALLDAVMCDL